jgi:hypothetical protein
MKLASNGIIKRLYRQEMSVGTVQSDPSFQQLDFQSVTPLLLVLGTGIFLSIFVFVIEVITHQYFAEAQKNIIQRTGGTNLLESAKVGSLLKGSAVRKTKKGNAHIRAKKKVKEVTSKFPEAFLRKYIPE